METTSRKDEGVSEAVKALGPPDLDDAVDRACEQHVALWVHGHGADHAGVRPESLHHVGLHQVPVEDLAWRGRWEEGNVCVVCVYVREIEREMG